MASFSRMSAFPAGHFHSWARWLLQERRDLAHRIQAISAEINRIGFIQVVYRSQTGPDGQVTRTEEPLGLTVTPQTSLEKLLQAYVANGGNPFDISPFLMPDRGQVLSLRSDGTPIRVEEYPYGGVVASTSVGSYVQSSYSELPGGTIQFSGFYPGRVGYKGGQKDLMVARTVHEIRGWANQSIRTKLQDMEWRVIKLMDTREQLQQERDVVLVQAFGGTCDSLPQFNPDSFDQHLRVQSLIADMNELLYTKNPDGSTANTSAGFNTAFMPFTFPDKISELRDAMG